MDESDLDQTLASRERTPPPGETGACLVAIYGPDLGRRVPLREGQIVLGRDPTCDIPIPLDEVSRRHCQIAMRGGCAYVCDLGSTNGTCLNDREIPAHDEMVLRSGDNVRVGGAIWKFLEGGNVEALYHEEVYKTAIIDGLTSIYNRRYLTDFLEREIARSDRHGRSLCLVLFDVDHFKDVNDEHGHVAGDHVLRELAALVRGSVRREECLARYGGDEFAIVVPDTPLDGVRTYAERVRGMVEIHPFVFDSRVIPVTVSLGIGVRTRELREPAQLVRLADQKLYQAKRAGRNCVCE